MPGARGEAFSPQGAKTFSWEGRGGASAWGGGEMARPVMEGQRNRRETRDSHVSSQSSWTVTLP